MKTCLVCGRERRDFVRILVTSSGEGHVSELCAPCMNRVKKDKAFAERANAILFAVEENRQRQKEKQKKQEKQEEQS